MSVFEPQVAEGAAFDKIVEQLLILFHAPDDHLQKILLHDFCHQDEDSQYFPVWDKDTITCWHTHGLITLGESVNPTGLDAAFCLDYESFLHAIRAKLGEGERTGQGLRWKIKHRWINVEACDWGARIWFDPARLIPRPQDE